MQVGRAQVQVVMAVMRVVMVVVSMLVMVIVMVGMAGGMQQPGTQQVHQQPQQRQCNGLLVVDLRRVEQPLQRLCQHQGGHAQQHQRAAEATQNLDFPGAKGKALVVCIAPGSGIGQCRQPQRQRVRAHMPAVGQQRHGVEPPAAADFQQHGDQCQPHGPAGIALCKRVA